MKKLLASLALFLMFIVAQAQPGSSSLKGQIVDPKGGPLPGAVASLLRAADSFFYKGTAADKSGNFVIEDIPSGNYLLKISHSGYEPYISGLLAFPGSGLPVEKIQLTVKNNVLETAVIVATRPVIEQRIDATVINLTALVRKEAPNAFEVLRFAPNVSLSDNEDNIKMNGKDFVQVMLNGKLVRMTGRDLVKLLKSLPSSSVTQVDVMSNPSSKYDIQGNGGVINIKLKKPETQGVNGNLSLGDTKGVNHLGDLSASINYGLGKVSLTTYLAYHYGRYQTKFIEDRVVNPKGPNTYAQNRNNIHLDQWSDPVIRLGADWFINSRHTIGALVELEKSTNTASYQTLTSIGKLNAPYDSAIYATSKSPNTRKWNTYNLNYGFSDTSGNSFTLDLDRSYYDKTDENNIFNMLRKGVAPEQFLSQNRFTTNTIIDIFTFKGDYEKIYKSKLKLEAGFKISDVNTKNDQWAQYMSTNKFITDTANTTNFKYKERINVAYFTVSKRIKKWGIQAGLRVEHTQSDGAALNLQNTRINRPDTSYLSILPSLFITYAPNWKNNFRLSMTRRIKRPAYEDLQPFDYQVDQFYYHLGNPSLRPQKNYNAELNYSYHDKLTMTAAYTYTKDYFTDVIFQEQGILYEMIQNAGISRNFNLNVSYPISFKKWWSGDNRLAVTNNFFKGPLLEGYLNEGRWSYNLYSSQRFVLPGEYILRITGRYNSPDQQLYFRNGENSSVSASVGKQLFNKKGILRLGVTDIFFTQRRITDVNFGNLLYTQKNTWESRTVFFEFSLKFGSTRVKTARDRETGNSDEKGRTR